MKWQIPLTSSTSQASRIYFGIFSPLQCSVWKELHQTRKRNPHQLQLSMLYLFAFSRTERVRKLIHIPSLFPKIHSRIPAHRQTVRGNPPVWTCTQTALAHRCNLRPGWSARSWSEWRFAARQEKQPNLYEESELWKISTNNQHPFLRVQQEMTYRFDARQHADISGEVRGLENGLVLPPEVQVHHQRLELLSNDPRFVFQIPSVRRTDWSGDVLTKP